MSSCLAYLKRSSPSISKVGRIQRLTNCSFFNQAQAQAQAQPPSSSSATSTTSNGEDTFRRDFFLKSVSGIVLGSALGLGFWSFYSSNQSSISFADSSATSAAVFQHDLNLHSSVDDDAKSQKKQKFLFADSFRKKIFFNYEKRIRMRSPPEKVFEYFASLRNPEGEVFMTPADLMRAVVPVFPPSESDLVREGYLRGERGPGELQCAPSSFFMLFDTNDDGLISFAEYIFFVTLLSIPESSFSVAIKMFDVDNSGEIDKEEFMKVMALMRAHNRQGANHRDGRRVGLKVGDSVENGGLLEYFFGKDGKLNLQHDKFVAFLRELHNEIVNLEFAHYDYKLRGSISAKDFALSMVASADLSHISKFLSRVDEIDKKPCIRDIRISLEEFRAFAELRRQLQPLSLAIFSYGKMNGLLTKKDLQRAASHVCGVSLTNNLVDVIFHVFDMNGDGSLSTVEFVRVLQQREKDIADPNAITGIAGLVSCWLGCAKNCSFKEALF